MCHRGCVFLCHVRLLLVTSTTSRMPPAQLYWQTCPLPTLYSPRPACARLSLAQNANRIPTRGSLSRIPSFSSPGGGGGQQRRLRMEASGDNAETMAEKKEQGENRKQPHRLMTYQYNGARGVKRGMRWRCRVFCLQSFTSTSGPRSLGKPCPRNAASSAAHCASCIVPYVAVYSNRVGLLRWSQVDYRHLKSQRCTTRLLLLIAPNLDYGAGSSSSKLRCIS